MLWSAAVVAAFLCVLWFHAKRVAVAVSPNASLLQAPRKILLVTAHPDDESFFFTPTIKGVRQRQPISEISLLCLSSGNAAGIGKEREKELKAAVTYLGLRNLIVIEDEHLQDGHHSWDAAMVQRHITQAAKKLNVDTIVTFDPLGVSGHPNHCSVALAAINFARSAEVRSERISVYALTTVPLWRKYISALDVFFTPKREGQLIGVNSVSYAWHAMSLHASQFVWYRRAFVLLSRYSLVNNLQLVT